jgi:hypothetical protein
MGVDGRHGAQVEMPAAKKLSLKDLYPPWRGEESFHVEEDVGAALKSILYSAVLWTYTMVLAIQTKP